MTLILPIPRAVYGFTVGTGSHVLLLTASHDEGDMYAVWLESCGYRVTVAQNAASARHIARTESVQVLVIDALFGAASGRAEVTRRWSHLAHLNRLPVVVLSGYVADVGHPGENGKLVVLKPCAPDQLSGYIERLLSAPVAEQP